MKKIVTEFSVRIPSMEGSGSFYSIPVQISSDSMIRSPQLY